MVDGLSCSSGHCGKLKLKMLLNITLELILELIVIIIIGQKIITVIKLITYKPNKRAIFLIFP